LKVESLNQEENVAGISVQPQPQLGFGGEACGNFLELASALFQKHVDLETNENHSHWIYFLQFWMM
jgi:hypothetical protein